MRKSLRTNKRLDQLEDTQHHQMSYPLGQKDHNVIADPQYIMEIILLIEFVTLLLTFVRTQKLEGEWCSVCTVMVFIFVIIASRTFHHLAI